MLHKRNGVLCSTLLTFVFALCSLSALGQKQSIDPNSPASVQSKPIVIQEVGHAVTPPLRDIPPVLPAGGTNRVIPVRPLHPFSTTAAPTTEDPVWQQFVVKNVSATSGLNFDGISTSDLTGGIGAPPDTNGAVGLTQYVQWVNSSFAVFDKSNGAIIAGPTPGNTLFTGFGGPCETGAAPRGYCQLWGRAARYQSYSVSQGYGTCFWSA